MLGNTYGWRARLGLILPSLNVTTEPEFYRMVPEGVTIHTTRMRLERATEESYAHLAMDVPDAEKVFALLGQTSKALKAKYGFSK